METKAYIPELVERLKKLHPYKIILFGSHAYGDADQDSDIDLLVVTDSEVFPKNYQEKMEIYLAVARVIRDIRKQVPVDLIVHTRAMYKKFVELESMFSREILQKGVVLYEADHTRVA
jgi:uncharacterized protein